MNDFLDIHHLFSQYAYKDNKTNTTKGYESGCDFHSLALQSQIRPLTSKSHTLATTPGCFPVTCVTYKDIAYENMFVSVHKICICIS